MRNSLLIVSILSVLLWAYPAAGQRITLPLAGYYRPGHYIPVRIETAGQVTSLRLEATGALPTEIHQPRASVIVPLLVLEGTLTELRVLDADGAVMMTHATPLQGLMPTQRLMGVIGDAPPENVMPREGEWVRISLDRNDLLLSPALAWTGLDALAMDADTYRRLSPQGVEALLAGGVQVLVRTSGRLDERPRMSQEGWQVLVPTSLGPRGARLIEEAYRPTYGWSPGWSPVLRQTVAMGGGGVGLLAIGATFLPRRWRTWGVVVVAGGGLAAAVALRAMHPPVFTMQAEVMIMDTPISRQDTWSWQKSPLGGEFAFLMRDVTWPIFASRQHRQRLEMHLRTAGDGTPVALVYTLPPQATIAFLSRSEWADSVSGPTAVPSTSRLMPMVRRLYRNTHQTPTSNATGVIVTPR